MAKKLIIKINNDGTIVAKTEGIKGKSCVKYMDFFETMIDGDILESEYTSEYYEIQEEQENIRADIKL